ncbi:MAG TPA: hypothetical protein VGG16_15035, partial [Streptosporangiaceae bacterium]
MSKKNTRRVIRRATGIAFASAGIYLLICAPAGQAQAATVGQPTLISGLTSGVTDTVQGVTDPVTSTLGSIVSTVTNTVALPAASSTSSSGTGSQDTQSAST